MSNLKPHKHTPILIVGAGSIGERHIRNLHGLGYSNLIVFRRRNLPFRDIGTASPKVCTEWQEVMSMQPKIAFICTVTHLHLQETMRCAKAGMHIMVEKPLTHTLDGLSQLREVLNERGNYLQVGYMMRYHPFLRKIKNIIADKELGSVVSIQSKWAEYLPDWHPWEDYRTGYAARKEMGGGVGLTLSHEIDQAFFITDELPEKWFTLKNFTSKLEINVEAGMDVLMKFPSGITANVHVNFYEKVKERFLKVVFDEATVTVDFFKSTLNIQRPNEKVKTEQLVSFDRNDLFIDQTNHFFSNISAYGWHDVEKQLYTSESIIKICTE